MSKVLVSDNIAAEGIALLAAQAAVEVKTGLQPAELLELIPDYDALVVRSETKVTAPVIAAGRKLRVIARAGIGVDNIDLAAATGAGIAVVNAPIGNTVAAAEHSLALMLALARNIPQAYQSLKQGEWRRSAFIGIEVHKKSLGIVGLGRVGAAVAQRAQSFGMQLLAYDPFVNPDYARRLGAELLPLNELLSRADFVTLHTPLTPATANLISSRELALMQPDARLINVARGELVDEAALLQALEDGWIAGAALDVFVEEPPKNQALLSHPKIMVTPHLGASTQEAQREVAIEAAEQALAVLDGRPARNTVNAPFMAADAHDLLAPHRSVAELVGRLLTHLADDQFVSINIAYEGEIAQHDTLMLDAAVLSGLLTPISSEQVNLINAPVLARQRGLPVVVQRNSVAPEYASLITVTLTTSSGDLTVAGASLRNAPHIVKVNEHWMDLAPTAPYLLFVDNTDQPGSIGAVGTVVGRHNINISFMEVGRLSQRGGSAMMVLGLDDPASPAVLQEVQALPQVHNARLVAL